MTRRGELRKRITRPFDFSVLQRQKDGFASLDLNRYERLAVQGLLEALETLIARQRALDECRRRFPLSSRGLQNPTVAQRDELFELTKSFFDSYYSCMGHVLSVVSRFSGVFGRVNYTEITPFIAWLGKHARITSHAAIEDLERARLFRAITNHPQQFPVVDWGTSVDQGTREMTYVHLFGPVSRNGTIPRGATRADPLATPGDWVMNAPDDLSVLNCVGNAAAYVAIEIIAGRGAGSAFRPQKSRRVDAIKQIIGTPPPGVDIHQLID